jgi:putative acetyltransferase
VTTQHHVVRIATPADDDRLGRVMFDSVHGDPSPYSEAQRRAWIAAPRGGGDWSERLAAQHVVLAEDAAGEAVGFMSLAEGGYVDFAYLIPAARGTGLFRRLFRKIEAEAGLRGVRLLWVHASLMAEPAFAAMGFAVTEREEVAIGEERLARCRMERAL